MNCISYVSLSVDPIPINEGTAEGVEIITVSASDLDTHPANTEIRYSIVSGNNDVSIIMFYTFRFLLALICYVVGLM